MPRHSAAVYRRRRVVLLGCLILLLAAIGIGVWLLVAQPWAHAAGPAPTSSASPSPTAAETPTSDPVTDPVSPGPTTDVSESETPAIVACEAKDIVVAAVTDADSYQAGVLPKISISLTNTGPTDCTMDVGSTTQAFTVMSGSDVWWRSTDCQENPSSMIATLSAGTTVTSKDPVTWDRTRSSVETCGQENRQRAPGGGASYHVEVSIGGFTSASSKQILLY
ncbi:hypothetical protein SRABI76_03316 [Microbacterium oxydans]|uniref:DUF4232 domain-containing protein n=1 Tax=Microbacterium oxydans TaxID=82380 RepID=A0A0F0LBG4_9MICO|nr:hypothetical protein [Microbacterium oxydans]KJL30542.1 hypothetical protein RS83_00610 [Microbacterium oxydans]CAH0254054.1 hypothetical protein SRABI76_03316 [Microbacterium oxydans]